LRTETKNFGCFFSPPLSSCLNKVYVHPKCHTNLVPKQLRFPIPNSQPTIQTRHLTRPSLHPDANAGHSPISVPVSLMQFALPNTCSISRRNQSLGLRREKKPQASLSEPQTLNLFSQLGDGPKQKDGSTRSSPKPNILLRQSERAVVPKRQVQICARQTKSQTLF
jgi:hypothetical protein